MSNTNVPYVKQLVTLKDTQIRSKVPETKIDAL